MNWGWKKVRSKQQHVASPEAGTQGLLKARKEGKGGQSREGNPLRPLAQSQSSLQSLPSAGPPAAKSCQPPAHNQGLWQPATHCWWDFFPAVVIAKEASKMLDTRIQEP